MVAVKVLAKGRRQPRRRVDPDTIFDPQNARQREHPSPRICEKAFCARPLRERGDRRRRKVVDEPHGIWPASRQHRPPTEIAPGQPPPQVGIAARDRHRAIARNGPAGLTRFLLFLLHHGWLLWLAPGGRRGWLQPTKKISAAARTLRRDAAYGRAPQRRHESYGRKWYPGANAAPRPRAEGLSHGHC